MSTRHYLRNPYFLKSSLLGFILLLLSLVLLYFAILAANELASNYVEDIVLSNIGPYDVEFLFLYAPLFFWAGVIIYVFGFYVQSLPFLTKTLALFVLIRGVAINLTHLGSFPSQIPIEASGILGTFSYSNDLFFSGHTGLPFLLALIFWHQPIARWIFITSALFFGMVVLLGHLHYSIDVFGAFFVSYAVFKLAEKLLRRDRRLFLEGLNVSSAGIEPASRT